MKAEKLAMLRAKCAAWSILFMFAVSGLGPAFPAWAGERLICASTTSTQNSGLFEVILPVFEKQTGIKVAVVAVGTGQALEMARRGDADVVLVHDPAAEQKFVEEGYGIKRRQVMYNDFIVVGPASDPANIKGLTDVVEAFQRIGNAGFAFISRGDRSGTHSKELIIWEKAGMNPQGHQNYLEAGQGMASTLRIANEKQFYTMVDRGTWLAAKDCDRSSLTLLVEGDPLLFNQYSVIVVNPASIPHAKVKAATAFADWLVSPAGQNLIGDFRDQKGNQLFIPNAKPAAAK